MDKRVYWIWMQHAFGPGSPTPWRIHQNVSGGAEGFWEAGPRLWNSLKGIREREAMALHAFSLEEAQAQLEYALRVGWEVLTPECAQYPQALTHIFDPPAVLYGKGELPDLESRPAIAVVGSRNARRESEEKAKEFGYQLAIGGAAVITGGAVGIDAAVTLGAMSGQGPVVSVLPVALNSSYLAKNAFLRESILDRGGALLTEYFSQQTPVHGTFQARNRLITGLSCGVLLIQAARKSGTVMYASFAKDQNRDVFVWPGLRDDPLFAGGWDLIEEGAKTVERGEEVLEEYSRRFAGLGKVISLFPQGENLAGTESLVREPLAALADPGVPELPGEQALVLEALGKEPLPLPELEEATGLPAGRILSALTELELRGLVESLPGKRYRRKTGRVRGEKQGPRERPVLSMTGEQAAVLAALGREPKSVAQLEEASGIPAGRVLSALTELELLGLCQSCPGKRYRRG